MMPLMQGVGGGPAPDSVRVVVRQVLAAREYDWSRPPRESLWSKVFDLLGIVVAWLDRLHAEHPASYYIVIGAMAAMLAAILVHFGFLLWRSFRPVAGEALGTAPVPVDIRDAEWHLAEAVRLSQSGRYAEALGHRFVALVLGLERRHSVRFNPSKTPAEYAREAQVDPIGRDELMGLVETLYRHLFGGRPCTAEVWEEFDRIARDVGSHVAPA